jgi:hypothetical protein
MVIKSNKKIQNIGAVGEMWVHKHAAEHGCQIAPYEVISSSAVVNM